MVVSGVTFGYISRYFCLMEVTQEKLSAAPFPKLPTQNSKEQKLHRRESQNPKISQLGRDP